VERDKPFKGKFAGIEKYPDGAIAAPHVVVVSGTLKSAVTLKLELQTVM
jgi:hypothetical protein